MLFVSKVFHRHNKKPMPTRKVVFCIKQDLLKVGRIEYPYRLNEKQKHTVKKKRDKEWCVASIVIALTILQLTALSKPDVTIVDRVIIYTQGIVNHKVNAQSVVGHIEVHQSYFQN